MSGLRVPVFFGSILTLVVLVIQNRTPVFQITLLGMQSQPLSLGVLVAFSVIAGIALGTVLQRTGVKRVARSRSATATSPSTSYNGPDEFQTFRSIPDPKEIATDASGEEWDESDVNKAEFDRPMSGPKTKGWGTEISNSWTDQAEQLEEEGRFWSRPTQKTSSRGSVTPIKRNQNKDRPQPKSGEEPESVVDAEYRIVPPEQPNSHDGFDDNFFDDFFDDDET